MTAIQHFLALYRFWAPVHGRIKAALMALKETIKPLPF
jgi:hypothetical protein